MPSRSTQLQGFLSSQPVPAYPSRRSQPPCVGFAGESRAGQPRYPESLNGAIEPLRTHDSIPQRNIPPSPYSCSYLPFSLCFWLTTAAFASPSLYIPSCSLGFLLGWLALKPCLSDCLLSGSVLIVLQMAAFDMSDCTVPWAGLDLTTLVFGPSSV
ncbi:uncharacterized protein BJX67DRAFT_327933 [Aspergillus lucknowensis]|uniref:Uncharacterized protein n=1 Tax=Aspergillus lucknowensis TaxID=176173 RepID=A0ABR4L8B3_9EURO